MNDGGKASEELTMRDHFAAFTLQGLLAAPDQEQSPLNAMLPPLNFYQRAALQAYLYADAMIEARSGETGRKISEAARAAKKG